MTEDLKEPSNVEIKKIVLRTIKEDGIQNVLVLIDELGNEYYFRVENGFCSSPLTAIKVN